jgi:hypothetical protein
MTQPTKSSDPPGCCAAMAGLLVITSALTLAVVFLATGEIPSWLWTVGGIVWAALLAWAKWEDRRDQQKREQARADQGKGASPPSSAPPSA